MKNNIATQNKSASTYKMLVQSEEKERGLFESAVFLFLIVSAALSIWQFARQPLPIPGEPNAEPAVMAQAVATPEPGA